MNFKHVIDKAELAFMKSIFSTAGVSGDENKILKWLSEQVDKISVKVERIDLENISKWKFDKKEDKIDVIISYKLNQSIKSKVHKMEERIKFRKNK